MQNHTNFIAVDPTKTRKARERDHNTGLQCQTCFKCFEKHQELRDHIADYQLEQQQLAARLLEAQAHLPRKSQAHERCRCHNEPKDEYLGNGRKEPDVDSDSDTGDDINDNSDVDNDGYENGDGSDDNSGDQDGDKIGGRAALNEMHTSTGCPYPRCHRRAQFKTRAGLERHYESHVQCHEICVFCRQLCKQVRKFMRHECHARRKANDEAKEFYRRERCAQLKRYSAKKLRRVLASGEARNSQINKRKFGHSDGFPAIDAPKVRKRDPTQVSDAMFMTTENLYGFPPSQQEENQVQLPLFSSSHSTGTNPSTILSNTSFPPKMLPHGQSEPEYDALIHQPYAPIFGDITITPSYDLVQESYVFSSNLQNAHYPAIPQHEASRTLPTSDHRV